MTAAPSEQTLEVLKEIPPLMPQFLAKRRAGLAAAAELARRLDIDAATLVAMRTLYELQGSYGGEPVTIGQIRSSSELVYSTIDTFGPRLEALLEKGLAVEDAAGGYFLTPWAKEATMELHERGRAHVARLTPLSAPELDALSRLLARVVEAVLVDPVLSPRPGSHLAGSRALDVFGADAPAMVRIEQSVLDLWRARDDAHIKAWRDAGMEGPAMPVMQHIWRVGGASLDELASALSGTHDAAGLEAGITYLVEKEYATRHGETVSLTPAGVVAREDIERDTDRIYFASWPLTRDEAAWLRDTLGALVENISKPAMPSTAGNGNP